MRCSTAAPKLGRLACDIFFRHNRMALLAALLPDVEDRTALQAATAAHDIMWADTWRELHRAVRGNPIATAVADLHGEKRKDGVLRVFRFRENYPLTPLVVWGDLDGRDLYRLGKAGASEVVLAGDAEDPQLVEELLAATLDDGFWPVVDERLRGRIGEGGRDLVRYAAERVPHQAQVPELAERFGVSVSTLERRCESWGLPTPGRLLLWLRVLWGLRWLLEPGRSVESVAEQLGYSSGAAFRRAIKATVGGRPSPLRNARGVNQALEQFLAECPGDGAYRRLATGG